MADLLLLPAALLLILGLRAVRRGDPRPHGHFMAAGVLVIGTRLLLPLSRPARGVGLGVLALAGITLLLGLQALAWREGKRPPSRLPRLHRAFGALTLIALALATAAWLLSRLAGS